MQLTGPSIPGFHVVLYMYLGLVFIVLCINVMVIHRLGTQILMHLYYILKLDHCFYQPVLIFLSNNDLQTIQSPVVNAVPYGTIFLLNQDYRGCPRWIRRLNYVISQHSLYFFFSHVLQMKRLSSHRDVSVPNDRDLRILKVQRVQRPKRPWGRQSPVLALWQISSRQSWLSWGNRWPTYKPV